MRAIRFTGLTSCAALSLLALGACTGKAPDVAASPSASAAPGSAPDLLAPDNAPHVSVLDPVIKLPAVSGSPGVLYFTIQQDAGKANTLVAVHVDGVERAEMHQTKTENGMTSMDPVTSVTFSQDQPAEFKAGGYHVMLFKFDSTVKAGKDVEVTFTLANGDKVSAFAKVEEAGGMMDHM